MALAMQSSEFQFAQRLASSEKGVRDRAVRKLRQYLSARTQSDTGSFSQEELLKIWKGLFYCMWVQDEPLLQEELANIISQLIHVVNSLESNPGQIQALGSNRTLKKPLKTEDDFVKFDTRFLPKPLFFRKAKNSSATRPQGPAGQLNKTPSSSKKVTFGLNRNMTAEFKKTDKSILVSPTGLSRVAFNPEQRPLHGVLKTATSSPASTPLSPMRLPATTPKRRPRAADFF